jgi:DNA-binding NarL/FixJ family response regulator
MVRSKITVAIADDHPVFRQGVSTLLGLEDDIEVVAMAEDGRGAIELLDREEPDILLLDLRMPGVDGLSALRQMSHRDRRTRVIVLTASEDQVEYVQAISDGASGVLLKQTAVDSLADCIRVVHAGELWVDHQALPLPEDGQSSVVRCS